MRDITIGDTLYVLFTTRAFATGIPTVLAGTPVISAYVGSGLTQITAGITLGVDHDGVVGLNLLTIVATTGNGYANATDVSLVITTGTVGGVSVVGETVGGFTIGRSAAAVDLANGTDGLGAIKTETALIVEDTNELQVDWTNTGRLDTILDAIPTTAMRGTDGVDTATMRGTDSAALASVATEARLAELDAANLPATTDSILTDTADIQPNYATSASIAALNDLSAAQILTTQLTESYSADGAAPTLTQALMMIQQLLGDFAITGTTLSVKGVDGATEKATYTLDSGTAPTSVTRTT